MRPRLSASKWLPAIGKKRCALSCGRAHRSNAMNECYSATDIAICGVQDGLPLYPSVAALVLSEVVQSAVALGSWAVRPVSTGLVADTSTSVVHCARALGGSGTGAAFGSSLTMRRRVSVFLAAFPEKGPGMRFAWPHRIGLAG